MDIEVLFFGVLADVTGTGRKHFRNVKSFNDLKCRIGDEYPELIHYTFRIAVNNEIVDGDPLLTGGEEVALLPPFAGG